MQKRAYELEQHNKNLRNEHEEQIRMNEYLKMDLDKAKDEIIKELQRGDQLKKDLWVNVDMKDRSENDLKELAD